MDRRRTDKPLYTIIADDIQKSIVKGNMNPGDILPSEHSLAVEYSVSRETVRKGLRLLETDGYIYAVAGKGYFVSQPAYSQFSLFFQEEEGSSDLVNVDLIFLPTDHWIAQALKLRRRSAVISMERVMSENGVPYAVDMKYLPYQRGRPTIEEEIKYAVFPELIAKDLPSYSFYTEMQITAEPATGKIASHLHCHENTPLLVMHRYFITNRGETLAYGVRYLLGGKHHVKCFSGNVPDHVRQD